jgi:hypothetical protein
MIYTLCLTEDIEGESSGDEDEEGKLSRKVCEYLVSIVHRLALPKEIIGMEKPIFIYEKTKHPSV